MYNIYIVMLCKIAGSDSEQNRGQKFSGARIVVIVSFKRERLKKKKCCFNNILLLFCMRTGTSTS